MTAAQAREASLLEQELRLLASTEKAAYRRQTMSEAARLLRDLLNADDDEPCTGPTDDL